MCDAMHFAEELTGRYRKNRKGHAAVSISDPSHISCVANDFGYEYIFSRYLESHGSTGDALIAISTSGTRANVIEALKTAKKLVSNLFFLVAVRIHSLTLSLMFIYVPRQVNLLTVFKSYISKYYTYLLN